MKRFLLASTLLLAIAGTPAWSPAWAGDDPHNHSATSKSEPSAAPTQTHRHGAANQGERDVMKEMQSTPPHDHDNCCAVKKSNPTQ